MSDPIRVCSVAELPEAASAVVADIDGRRVAIARDSDGSLHAFDDTCTHGAVSLAEGEVGDGVVECWLHGSQFDLRTGVPRSLPATKPVAVHTLTVQGDDVYVTLAA